jgi:hypothetical protein
MPLSAIAPPSDLHGGAERVLAFVVLTQHAFAF